MMNDIGETPYIKEKWLQDFVEKVGQQLNVKKEMDILSTEIPKEMEEIEYLRGRVATSRKRLDDMENAAREVESRLAGPRKNLTDLQKERRSVSEAYDGLKEKERDIAKRTSELPKIQAKIERYEKDVRELLLKLAASRAGHHEIVQRKQSLEEAYASDREILEALEAEILVMRNTRDIIGGNRPEQFDVETFETIQDDVAVNVKSYFDEMNGEIERIQNEIASMNAQIEEKTREAETLSSKRVLLRETIERLKPDISEEKDAETLTSEFGSLKDQSNGLTVETEELNQEIRRTEQAIVNIDERLEKERAVEGDSKSRHSYLISRKQEMDGFENVEDEIRRIGDEIQKLHVDSEIDKALSKTIGNLMLEVTTTEKRLRTSLEEEDRVFQQFQEEMESLLSGE